jgi:Tfp pilus assembly protein PilW
MKRPIIVRQCAFTVIELLLYMVISSTLIAGIYLTFAAQQKMYLHQNATAELQQNLRAGMYLMTKDIHSAGYNPARKTGLGFVTAFPSPNDKFIINYNTQKHLIAFTSDTNGDGVVNPNDTEMIAYRFKTADHTLGDAAGRARLHREALGRRQAHRRGADPTRIAAGAPAEPAAARGEYAPAAARSADVHRGSAGNESRARNHYARGAV